MNMPSLKIFSHVVWDGGDGGSGGPLFFTWCSSHFYIHVNKILISIDRVTLSFFAHLPLGLAPINYAHFFDVAFSESNRRSRQYDGTAEWTHLLQLPLAYCSIKNRNIHAPNTHTHPHTQRGAHHKNYCQKLQRKIIQYHHSKQINWKRIHVIKTLAMATNKREMLQKLKWFYHWRWGAFRLKFLFYLQ